MIIRFPAYRRYTKSRIEVNDAMIALVIGTRVSRHTLSAHSDKANSYLPTLFDEIPDIERLNRTSEDAARLLEEAEQHLVYMSIPYALATHNSLLVDVAKMLRKDNHEPKTQEQQEDLNKLTLEQAHEYIEDCCNGNFSTVWLSLFHFSRLVRNRVIHGAGTPGSRLRPAYNGLSHEARGKWEEITGRSFLNVLGTDNLMLDNRELAAVLSVTLRLAEEANALLGETINRATWASLVTDDYRKQYPAQSNTRVVELRKLHKYSQMLYGPLHLTETELCEAIDSIS